MQVDRTLWIRRRVAFLAHGWTLDQPDRKACVKAIEAYAQQVRNVEAERQACEIRLRAERRCGQLLREREMAQGAREPGTNRGTTLSCGTTASSAKTLGDLGISRDQSSRWQKMADIPEDEFEATLIVPGPKPTTTGIIEAYTPPRPVDVHMKALWLWGRLQDFERQGLPGEDPNHLISTMLDHMQETTRMVSDPATFCPPALRRAKVFEVMRAVNQLPDLDALFGEPCPRLDHVLVHASFTRDRCGFKLCGVLVGPAQTGHAPIA